MQTSITKEFLNTRAGQEAESILRKCVHCGFCTATCPTYQLLNDELDRNNTYGFRYFADFKLLDGLNFRLNYGRDINEGLNKSYENQIIGDAEGTGRYGELRFRREVENFNQILTYNKSFKDVHNLDLTAGHESFERTYSSNHCC